MKFLASVLIFVINFMIAEAQENKEGVYKTYQDFLSNNILELRLKQPGLNEMVLEKFEDKAIWKFKNEEGNKIEYGSLDFWAYQDMYGNLYTIRKLVWGKKNKTYLIPLRFWVVGEKHTLLSAYNGNLVNMLNQVPSPSKFCYYLSNPSDNLVQSFTHKELKYLGNITSANMHTLTGYSYDEEVKKVKGNNGFKDPKNNKIYGWRGAADPLNALVFIETYIQSVLDANYDDNSEYKIIGANSDNKIKIK